jgi:hypothetical protein
MARASFCVSHFTFDRRYIYEFLLPIFLGIHIDYRMMYLFPHQVLVQKWENLILVKIGGVRFEFYGNTLTCPFIYIEIITFNNILIVFVASKNSQRFSFLNLQYTIKKKPTNGRKMFRGCKVHF